MGSIHTYILSTGRVISPFNRPVIEMRIHDRTLQATQEQILRALGSSIERIDDLREVRRFPCLLIFDDLYFSYHALAGFLKAVRQGKFATSRHEKRAETSPKDQRGGQAALAQSPLTERFVPALQGAQVEAADGSAYRAYNCYYLRRLDPQRALTDQTELVPIPHKVKRVWSRANRYFEPSGRFSIPVSRVLMSPVRHWANLVTVNLLGMPAFLLGALRQRPVAAACLPAKMCLRAGSLRPGWMMGKLYLAGTGCQIHPSAHLEAVVLGRRVRIGPNVILRGCVVGDETQIAPRATIEGCTLGDRVTVECGAIMRCCAVDDEVNMGSLFTQLSAIGRGAVLCPDSGIIDFGFRGGVTTSFEGRMIRTGSPMLGACLGDRAFLGPGVRLLCGREIPNDCILIENPRGLVRNVEQGLPEKILRVDRRTPRGRKRTPKPRSAAG